jgi:hypothetical protein
VPHERIHELAVIEILDAVAHWRTLSLPPSACNLSFPANCYSASHSALIVWKIGEIPRDEAKMFVRRAGRVIEFGLLVPLGEFRSPPGVLLSKPASEMRFRQQLVEHGQRKFFRVVFMDGGRI